MTVRTLTRVGALIAGLGLASPALAQGAAPAIDHGDTAWILSATALVLFMTLPGLALFYAGLVRSKRGVGGGYVLARGPEEITLADIVSAVDGPIQAGDFGLPHTDGACEHEGQCVLLAVWWDAGERMREYLTGYTLADMAAMAQGDAPWPPVSASR